MPIIPSSLCFVNKSDPIHCAKSYLDQCWQAQGWISWSLTRAVWVTSWGNDSQAPGFSCWRRCFPLRSRAVKQNVLLVWQGVKGSRLHLPVEGNLERGKWGLMEKIENRNERNSLPLLLLARSDSSPPYIFYSSTVVYHTGPGPVRQISRRSFFCGGFCHFIDWEDDFFFFFCMWSRKKSEIPVVITRRHMRTLCLVLSVVWFQAKMVLLCTGGHCGTAVFWFPFSSISERSLVFSFSCPFWFQENYQSHTMDSFIFLYSLPLSTIPHNLVPPRLALFHPAVSCLSTKGPAMPLDQGRD